MIFSFFIHANKRTLAFTMSVLVCGLISCQTADPSSQSQEAAYSQSLDTTLAHILRQRALMGMSVLLIDSGEIVYEGKVGWADYKRKIPVTENTIYRVASISKTLTAIALLQLYEKGNSSAKDGKTLGIQWTKWGYMG